MGERPFLFFLMATVKAWPTKYIYPKLLSGHVTITPPQYFCVIQMKLQHLQSCDSTIRGDK